MKAQLILVVAIAGAYALAVGAQTAAPAADTKAKQEMVKSANQGRTQAVGLKTAEGSAAATNTKDMPKALPDKSAKQKSVQASTAQETKGFGDDGGAGSQRKEKPKMKENQKQLKKTATP